MIDTATGSRIVDRIRLAGRHPHDVRLVAGSVRPPDRARWIGRLAPFGCVGNPGPGLAYLAGDDWAAVLCLRAEANGSGGPDCRVLLGPPRLLTCRTALALHRWPGWSDPGWDGERHLDPVAAAKLSRAAELPRPDHFSPRDLVALARQLLRQPDQPLLAGADHLDCDGQVTLLRALLDVLEDLLYSPQRQRWTFSTAGATSDGSDAPRIVFLPAGNADGRNPPAHRFVPLPDNRGYPDDPYWLAAAALVSRYLHDGYAAMLDWLERREILGAPEPAERVRLLVRAVSSANQSPPPSVRRMPCRD